MGFGLKIGIIGIEDNCGKSTLVNALHVKQYAPVGIYLRNDEKNNTVTCRPHIYRGNDYAESETPDKVYHSCCEGNIEYSNPEHKKDSYHAMIHLVKSVEELKQIVAEENENDDENAFYFDIYDTPGMNNNEFVQRYFNQIVSSFHNNGCDVILLVLPYGKEVNMEKLKLIFNGMKYHKLYHNDIDDSRRIKNVYMVPIITKCDQVTNMNDIKENEDKINKIMQDQAVEHKLDNYIKPAISMKAEKAMVYRAIWTENTNQLYDKLIKMAGFVGHSSKQWNKFSEEEKKDKLTKLTLTKEEYDDAMKNTGMTALFDTLKQIFTPTHKYDIFTKELLDSLHDNRLNNIFSDVQFIDNVKALVWLMRDYHNHSNNLIDRNVQDSIDILNQTIINSIEIERHSSSNDDYRHKLEEYVDQIKKILMSENCVMSDVNKNKLIKPFEEQIDYVCETDNMNYLNALYEYVNLNTINLHGEHIFKKKFLYPDDYKMVEGIFDKLIENKYPKDNLKVFIEKVVKQFSPIKLTPLFDEATQGSIGVNQSAITIERVIKIHIFDERLMVKFLELLTEEYSDVYADDNKFIKNIIVYLIKNKLNILLRELIDIDYTYRYICSVIDFIKLFKINWSGEYMTDPTYSTLEMLFDMALKKIMIRDPNFIEKNYENFDVRQFRSDSYLALIKYYGDMDIEMDSFSKEDGKEEEKKHKDENDILLDFNINREISAIIVPHQSLISSEVLKMKKELKIECTNMSDLIVNMFEFVKAHSNQLADLRDSHIYENPVIRNILFKENQISSYSHLSEYLCKNNKSNNFRIVDNGVFGKFYVDNDGIVSNEGMEMIVNDDRKDDDNENKLIIAKRNYCYKYQMTNLIHYLPRRIPDKLMELFKLNIDVKYPLHTIIKKFHSYISSNNLLLIESDNCMVKINHAMADVLRVNRKIESKTNIHMLYRYIEILCESQEKNALYYNKYMRVPNTIGEYFGNSNDANVLFAPIFIISILNRYILDKKLIDNDGLVHLDFTLAKILNVNGVNILGKPSRKFNLQEIHRFLEMLYCKKVD